MLKTWEYGWVKIMKNGNLSIFDAWLGEDELGRWEYYYRPSYGDIVAVNIWEDFEDLD